MKRILQILIFFFSFVITTNGFALETLAKGKTKGRIKFNLVNLPEELQQILYHQYFHILLETHIELNLK